MKEEFERVVLPQISHLYTASFYLTRDKTEAEDLVQETCLRAFRFFDQFPPGTNCRPGFYPSCDASFLTGFGKRGGSRRRWIGKRSIRFMSP